MPAFVVFVLGIQKISSMKVESSMQFVPPSSAYGGKRHVTKIPTFLKGDLSTQWVEPPIVNRNNGYWVIAQSKRIHYDLFQEQICSLSNFQSST